MFVFIILWPSDGLWFCWKCTKIQPRGSDKHKYTQISEPIERRKKRKATKKEKRAIIKWDCVGASCFSHSLIDRIWTLVLPHSLSTCHPQWHCTKMRKWGVDGRHLTGGSTPHQIASLLLRSSPRVPKSAIINLVKVSMTVSQLFKVDKHHPEQLCAFVNLLHRVPEIGGDVLRVTSGELLL